MKLILATSNKGKVREIGSIFLGTSIEFTGLDTLTNVPEIIEDGITFKDNAYIKAKTIYDFSGADVMSEDSGLCVDYLNGAPGVFSARFAGPAKTDSDNIEKVLTLMKDVPEDKRTAQFRSAFCLIIDGIENFFEGYVKGRIITAPRGSGGFGYDPIFVPDGYSQTFAEIGDDIKNSISHRAMAFEKLKVFLLNKYI
ncbi:MAG: RdgB/HAM1 family non-canonical purine NTP pyrophosphatase [Nitrospirae bacterium]|nr:RdgB/HAM1 family non-canonical purine NTP pyrophosphatase [Nitrospirota bacterium]MBF0541841.1 RdgB/HAM1 family non-canonical purine NTP pyrophosphatase [Nitrospirota bacterium]